MRATLIGDLIVKASHDERTRDRIARGHFPSTLSKEEQMAVQEAVLRMKAGVIIPAHMVKISVPLAWFITYVPAPQ